MATKRPQAQKSFRQSGSRLKFKEFVERAIRTLRNPKYKGIHVVYSGFNQAFRQYYKKEPRPVLDKLAAEGLIVVRPARGGAIIMLASDCNSQPGTDGGQGPAQILNRNSKR